MVKESTDQLAQEGSGSGGVLLTAASSAAAISVLVAHIVYQFRSRPGMEQKFAGFPIFLLLVITDMAELV